MGAHVEIWSVRIVVAAQLFGQDVLHSDNDGAGDMTPGCVPSSYNGNACTLSWDSLAYSAVSTYRKFCSKC